LNKKEEKWAIFWCDLLSPIIFSKIEPEQTNGYLKQVAQKAVVFPNGELGRPSLSTLKRKLKKYQNSGFNGFARKKRNDQGKSRNIDADIIDTAIAIKKEQPRRSHKTINRFLKEMYGTTIPRSTLYWHLKQAGATRLKLGVTKQKVRKRWSRDHTHDLWIGDFEEGPYVIESNEVVPTYLSAFIDCHSRFVVTARYYLRQNLDILIDSLIRAMATHGAPLALYVDNAKVYHSHGLRAACYRINTRLIHRKKGDPAPGGLIERFFLTVQDQFEAEIRAGHILSLSHLNHTFAAWMEVDYHQETHSEINQPPAQRYQKGLRVIRQIDLNEFIKSFMQKVSRCVHRTFSDVQVNKKYYKVDPKLRGDKVEVRYDSFTHLDSVEIYSLKGQYLGTGKLHHRQFGEQIQPSQTGAKPKHNYLDLIVRQHKKQLDAQTKGIDFRKVTQRRPWPFYDFAKTFAQLLGNKGGLASFTAQELETLKKVYNQDIKLNKKMLKQAFENARCKSITYVIHELKCLLKIQGG